MASAPTEDLTLREFCLTLDSQTASTPSPTRTTDEEVNHSDVTYTQHTEVLDTVATSGSATTTAATESEAIGVLVIPYLLIAFAIIIILVVDFARYRRYNSDRYKRKMEVKQREPGTSKRKVRGLLPVLMDPSSVFPAGSSSTGSDFANSGETKSAQDQGHEYVDEESAAARFGDGSPLSQRVRLPPMEGAKYANSASEAENGYPSLPLRFGKRKQGPAKVRFMNVLGKCGEDTQEVV